MVIQIEAQIVLSRLTYDIPKFDRSFTFYADDVMTSLHHTMKYVMFFFVFVKRIFNNYGLKFCLTNFRINKTYVFYNKGESQIVAKFEVINDPFTIDYIDSPCKTNHIHDFTKGICIDGWNSIKVS